GTCTRRSASHNNLAQRTRQVNSPEREPRRERRRLLVDTPRATTVAAQVRHRPPERARRPPEACRRGLVQSALDQRSARQPGGTRRALQRGAEQLTLEGVRPDVIVTDPCGIDEAPHHQRDTPHPASLPAILREEGQERPLRDALDQPA